MIYLYFFFLGTAIGSFLNVLIDRLPKDKSIMGRSHCDYCKRKLTAIDLIPLFSFIFLRGRCRTCKRKLSWQYPAIEFLTGVTFTLVYYFYSLGNLSLIGSLLFVICLFGVSSSLIVIFFTDVKHQIIPDQMQISLFIFSFLLRIIQLQILHVSRYALHEILYIFIAGVVVMTPILLIYLLTKGRGMGFGDVKLAFNMGIMLGIKSGLLALYFGFIIGAIYGIILIVLRLKKMKSKIAFGPFLILGIIIVVILKNPLYDFLLKTYGI
jgi:leader peptidase (prepilin peptidase) / N-methyltransferase